MTSVFRSRVDGTLTAVGLVLPCGALAAVFTASRFAIGALWLPVALLVLAAVFVSWVVLSTYYEFRDDALVAHSGPFRWRIALGEIRSVRESDSVRSGPALSMDRLEIVYGHGRVLLISPQDKPGFLAMLHRQAPQLAP